MQHYYAIASKATILKPAALNVPADKFEGQFGIGWQTALDSGKVFNAMDACEKLGLDADQMDKESVHLTALRGTGTESLCEWVRLRQLNQGSS